MVLFGALEPCDQENCSGKLIFDGNSTYRCNGIISNHGKCDNTNENPKRFPIVIPQELLNLYPFLNIQIDPKGRILPHSPERKLRRTKEKSKKTEETNPLRNVPTSSQMILKGNTIQVKNDAESKWFFLLQISIQMMVWSILIRECRTTLACTAKMAWFSRKY